jgi:hypothetical protein
MVDELVRGPTGSEIEIAFDINIRGDWLGLKLRTSSLSFFALSIGLLSIVNERTHSAGRRHRISPLEGSLKVTDKPVTSTDESFQAEDMKLRAARS